MNGQLRIYVFLHPISFTIDLKSVPAQALWVDDDRVEQNGCLVAYDLDQRDEETAHRANASHISDNTEIRSPFHLHTWFSIYTADDNLNTQPRSTGVPQ
jgi:hypothetical protein